MGKSLSALTTQLQRDIRVVTSRWFQKKNSVFWRGKQDESLDDSCTLAAPGRPRDGRDGIVALGNKQTGGINDEYDIEHRGGKNRSWESQD